MLVQLSVCTTYDYLGSTSEYPRNHSGTDPVSDFRPLRPYSV